MKLFFKNLKKFDYFFLKYESKIIFILYFSVIIFGSLLFAYEFSQRFDHIVVNNNIILKEIPFNHGKLINNLLVNSEYKIEQFGIEMFVERLPVLSFITILISGISENIYIFLLIKNVFFFSIFYIVSKNYCKTFYNNSYLFYFLSIAVIYNFYNFQTSLNFIFADSYLAILLPCLYILLVKNNSQLSCKPAIIISVFLTFLLFLKTTMVYLVLAIGILYFFEKKKNLLKTFSYLPIVTVFVGMTIWGLFGYLKTGKFPFLHKMISTNQSGLALVFNKRFNQIYPEIGVDIIYYDLIQNLPRYENEWEYNEYFKKKNVEYLKENKIEIIKGIIKKINFIFFYSKKNNEIFFWHILNRVIFFTSLVILIYKLINKIFTFKDMYFLIILGTFLFPFIVGWVTHKHLPPLFIISYIYSLINIYKIRFKTNN